MFGKDANCCFEMHSPRKSKNIQSTCETGRPPANCPSKGWVVAACFGASPAPVTELPCAVGPIKCCSLQVTSAGPGVIGTPGIALWGALGDRDNLLSKNKDRFGYFFSL